jgi:hypothetical protein
MINSILIGRQFEGIKLVGYVPKPDGGKIESGVTISSGFDIGQRTESQIDDAFDFALADKLSYYCNVTGNDAIRLLKHKPLVVTQHECDLISDYAHIDATRLLLEDWARSDSRVPFCSLPSGIQTVIASVAFQYGDLPTRCPMFWAQVTSQNWESMLRNLWNFGDAFENRRRQEYMLALWEVTQM